MTLRDFLSLLRSHWVIICISTLVAVVGAVVVTLLTTPTYVAYTRLFVSTPRSGSVSDLYEGDLYTKERVLTYAELLKGQNIAQRTIDKLHLDMTANQLRNEVTPVVARDTILIYLYISDPSPVRARDIANTMSDELVILVDELEKPANTPTVGTPGRVIIEQAALLPQKPNKPNAKRNVLAGLALGLLAGVGIAVLRASLDDKLKGEDELEAITGSGVIGAIPEDKPSRGGRTTPLGPTKSAVAEAFRVVRTNLKYVEVDHPPRVILIASPTQEDGKTTAAVNIASALAEAEENVVLVDADLRRPSIADALDVVGEIGLSTVISGEAALTDALRATNVPRLSVLAAGPVPPNPSELLDSASARHVFENLRAQFDYVIIDSSPLKTATDAAVLAASSDGVLLIARYGQTRLEDVKVAVRVLAKVGAKVLGSVLNAVPVAKQKSRKRGAS